MRLTRDKPNLIRQSMENTADGYKKIQQLLKLAIFLKMDEQSMSDTESWIYDMCGNTAICKRDMKFCIQICDNIIAKNYETGWRIFTETAKYQSDPSILDYETRIEFMNYALNVCPDDEILNVLNSKAELTH